MLCKVTSSFEEVLYVGLSLLRVVDVLCIVYSFTQHLLHVVYRIFLYTTFTACCVSYIPLHNIYCMLCIVYSFTQRLLHVVQNSGFIV